MPSRPLAACMAAAACLNAPSAALAQDCEINESYRLGGAPTDALIANGHAFVSSANGVEVLVLSESSSPQRVEMLAFESPSIAIRDELLMVGFVPSLFAPQNVQGVAFFDISLAPAVEPRGVLTWTTTQPRPAAGQGSVRDNLAIVANGVDGAQVIDISDVGDPRLIATIPAPGGAGVNDVALLDGVAALFLQGGQMAVYDLSTPASPVLLSTTSVAAFWSLTTDSDLIYLAGVNELIIADLSNPAEPTTASTTPIPNVRDIAKSGDMVFLTNSARALIRVDVANPRMPFIIDECCAEGGLSSSTPRVAASPNYAVLTSLRQVRCINLADMPGPNVVGAEPRPHLLRGIAADGHRILFSSALAAQTGVARPDATIDAQGELPYPVIAPAQQGGNSAALSGDRALVTIGSSSPPFDKQLYLLDLSDPLIPHPINTTVLQGSGDVHTFVSRLLLVNDIAFVLFDFGFPTKLLRAYDAGSPSFDLLGSRSCVEVAARGDVLFLLEQRHDGWFLTSADARQPADLPGLDEVGPLPAALPNGWGALRIDEDRAYVLSSRSDAIATIDISDPSAMRLLGVASLPEDMTAFFTAPNDVEVRDGIAYITHDVVDDGVVERMLSAVDLGSPSIAVRLVRRETPLFPGFRAPTATTPTGVLIAGYHFNFVTCPCPGDTNGDNLVDMADLMTILDAFNTTPADAHYNPAADVDHDDDVDFADLNIVVSAFNTAC